MKKTFILLIGMLFVFTGCSLDPKVFKNKQDNDNIDSLLNETDKEIVQESHIEKANDCELVVKPSGYFRQENCLYFDGNLIEGFNFDNFEILNVDYVKDESSVYYKNNIISDQYFSVKADVNSFEIIGNGFSKDKKYVFYENGLAYDEIDNIQGVKNIGRKFFVYKNNVYCASRQTDYVVDINSFVIVEGDKTILSYYEDDYSKDKNNVYYGCDIVRGADPEFFISLGAGYGKDHESVYKVGVFVNVSDIETFEVIPNEHGDFSGYAKDKNFVYKNGNKLIKIDPEGFEVIENEYTKNSKYVYRDDIIVKNADPETFNPIDSSFARDAYRIYYNTAELIGSDYDTFWQLPCGYSKDKNNIYFIDKIISSADPKTFKTLNDKCWYGHDKNYVYFKDRIMKGMTKDEMEFLEGGYSKDKYNVFFEENIIKGADSATFKVDEYNSYNAQDKDDKYYKGQKID